MRKTKWLPVGMAGLLLLTACGSTSKPSSSPSVQPPGVKTLAPGESFDYRGVVRISMRSLVESPQLSLIATFDVTGLRNGAPCPGLRDVYLLLSTVRRDPDGMAIGFVVCNVLNRGETGVVDPYWNVQPQSGVDARVVLAPGGGGPVAEWTSSASSTTTSTTSTTTSTPTTSTTVVQVALPDPCLLVTQPEASAALGKAVNQWPGQDSPRTTCSYSMLDPSLATTPTNQSLDVDVMSETPGWLQQTQMPCGPCGFTLQTPVPGIGDNPWQTTAANRRRSPFKRARSLSGFVGTLGLLRQTPRRPRNYES
jgi:hypothetical protein